MPRARAYHHGNLKEALLEAAVKLVAERGPAGFTLREVARRAGVSHNAPYRHYKDREELLAEVARQGFEELGRALEKALAAAGEDPIDRFRAIGRTYVRFALKRPEHFAAMFDRRLYPDPYPQREAAGLATLAVLFEVLMECQAAGLMAPEDPHRLALKGWALVHGIAKLALAGFLQMERTADVLAFADEATMSGLHGLLLSANTVPWPPTGRPAGPVNHGATEARRGPRTVTGRR